MPAPVTPVDNDLNIIGSAASPNVVEGNVAHDSAIAGNPVRIGASARTTQPTAVTTGDVVNLIATTGGALISMPYQITELSWTYAAANLGIVNTTTAVTIKTAGGGGIRNYITSFTLMAEALGAATEFAIRDGAGGTVLWRTKIGTGGLVGGLHVVLPMPLASTANTLLEVVTLTASVTGAVYFNARGFTAV